MSDLDKFAQKMGENIQRFRKSKGLSQAQLARNCNLTPGYFCRIEGGQKIPPVSTLLEIAKKLGVTLNILMS